MVQRDGGETRQFNSRLPKDVHLIIELCARGRGVSMGKLTRDVLTAYAAKEAGALLVEKDQLIAEANERHAQELELIEQLGEIATWAVPEI